MATICALAVVLAGVAAYGWHVGWFAKSTSNGNTTTPQTSQTSALPRADVPSPKKNEPAAQAQRAVSAMTLEERVGQLVMVPLLAGSDPSSLASTITDEHIGSAILIGNWNTGADTVKTATAQLQGYAPAGNRLIIATDQEGGQVQHLTGTGFDTMPSAVEQGTMSADALRQSAGTWGSQLAAAGINVDLARCSARWWAIVPQMLRLARWIVISDWMRPATPNMASPLLKVCETLRSARRSNIILGWAR